MSELQRHSDHPVTPTVEVITEPAQVWIIAAGDLVDIDLIAAITGTDIDAEEWATKWNGDNPDAREKAYVLRVIDHHIIPSTQD